VGTYLARAQKYDNLKSAVLDRRGAAIQFHPRLLELAGHYHFAPRPCTPARGNEKGKVERQIQYLRHAFFAARTYRDLDDLNAQFVTWRDEVAHRRRHPAQPDRTVAEVFGDEQPRLLTLPEHPFETDLVTTVRSGKTPYIRFDRNLYSIPHEHARQPLSLVASDTRVRLLAGTAVIADHPRSFDTAAVVDDPAHVAALLEASRQRHAHGQRDYLRVTVPASVALFDRLAARGEPLTLVTRRLLGLLDDYGADDLTRAITIALDRGTVSVAAITHLIETAHRRRGAKPPMPLLLPDRPGVRDLTVPSHTLESYDDLTDPDPDDTGE
jgi:hypothetical protein